jgi:acyl-CoA reductase-like NAD-dependent aldehyde dehydrogenase
MVMFSRLPFFILKIIERSMNMLTVREVPDVSENEIADTAKRFRAYYEEIERTRTDKERAIIERIKKIMEKGNREHEHAFER